MHRKEIDSHWAYQSIAVLAGHGVISGYTDGTFRPKEKLLELKQL
ncbi:S-layer homology domain-containing protein [Paenibacillus antarcticus]